ncbi:hypothetical protein [Variovorax guangxiensis]|uniref:hypothetical protein n=1 Tax=Variovorax guangxiensis TaxID=1775474 RepID=UPI002854B4E4|nr:hypothetical protein [Variovorax guangxiensis]MDR6858518.1 hypothetical protein [Variovorax guangxiensis]
MRLPEITPSPAHALRSTHPCREPWEAREVRRAKDLEFAAMERAYHRTGGLALGDELAQRLGERLEQPISVVARWIVSRTVLSFGWRSQTLLPLFQFDAKDMSLRPAVADVVRELVDVFDDWELAVWFAQPNGWLRYAAPVDAIGRDPSAVLCAARAERFVARG